MSLWFLALLPAVFATVEPSSIPPATQREVLHRIEHERVRHHIRRYTGEKRDDFAEHLRRKKRHEAMIREMLERRGMPQDLIYLALVESGFSTEARSHAGAVGIWQLGAETARRYGLLVDDADDERRDAKKATEAALDHLSELYERFGSWYLAAAAYNGGENRVARIMRRVLGRERGTDADYYRIWWWLPAETRDFVPAMIAAATIGSDPQAYGF